MASSLIISNRNSSASYHRNHPSRLLPLTGTTLRNKKYDYNAINDADDFASFNNLGRGEDDDGRRLAREFYQELHNRQSLLQKSSSGNGRRFEDVHRWGEDSNKFYGESQAGKIKASERGNSKLHDRRRRTDPTVSPSSQDSSSPLFSFLAFFSMAPPRPSPSAGLFSGSGITVYSSGRSVRAEIAILEATLKRNDDQQSKKFAGILGVIKSGDAPQQSDEVFRIAVAILIVLSTAYIVFAIAGMTEALIWDSSAASLSHGMSLLNDATKTNVEISVGYGDTFMQKEAAWLIKQSSDLAERAAEAVRSVEELVLR